MANVIIPTDATDLVIDKDKDGQSILEGVKTQVSLSKLSGQTVTGGTLTLKARAAGAYSAEDVLDSEGTPVTIDLSNPATVVIENCRLTALVVSLSGVATNKNSIALEVNSLP